MRAEQSGAQRLYTPNSCSLSPGGKGRARRQHHHERTACDQLGFLPFSLPSTHSGPASPPPSAVSQPASQPVSHNLHHNTKVEKPPCPSRHTNATSTTASLPPSQLRVAVILSSLSGHVVVPCPLPTPLGLRIRSPLPCAPSRCATRARTDFLCLSVALWVTLPCHLCSYD